MKYWPAAGALLLAACYSWDPMSTPAPMTELGHVRAHPCNGNPVELHDARTTSDSLVGVLQEETAFQPRVLRAMPVDSVCGLDRHRVNVATTVVLTVGIPIIAGIVWAISTSATEPASP